MRRSAGPLVMGALGAMAVIAMGAVFVQGHPVGEAAGVIPPTAKIAVIDLGRAFNESDMKQRFQVELDADYQAKKARITEMGKELQRLKGEMELVTAGSAEYRSLQTQTLHKTADLQFEVEQSEVDFKKKRAERFEVVLDLVYKKTLEYCKAKDIDMVLQARFTLDENMPSWESVFYHRPEFDITDDVIRLINGT